MPLGNSPFCLARFFLLNKNLLFCFFYSLCIPLHHCLHSPFYRNSSGYQWEFSAHDDHAKAQGDFNEGNIIQSIPKCTRKTDNECNLLRMFRM